MVVAVQGLFRAGARAAADHKENPAEAGLRWAPIWATGGGWEETCDLFHQLSALHFVPSAEHEFSMGLRLGEFAGRSRGRIGCRQMIDQSIFVTILHYESRSRLDRCGLQVLCKKLTVPHPDDSEGINREHGAEDPIGTKTVAAPATVSGLLSILAARERRATAGHRGKADGTAYIREPGDLPSSVETEADGVFRWIRTGFCAAPSGALNTCHFASGEILRRTGMHFLPHHEPKRLTILHACRMIAGISCPAEVRS